MGFPTNAQLVAVAPLTLFILSWVLLGELIQGLLSSEWSKPWFLTYCIKSGFAISLIPYYILRRLRLSRPVAVNLPVKERTLIFSAAALSPISTVCTITWYISLSGTSFAGNSAVYQSATAFSLVLSYFLLREAITLRKAVCVVGAAIGVCMVIMGGSNSGGRNTVEGYAWVLLSTILYALYEVLYARLTKPIVGAGNSVEGRENASTEAESPLLPIPVSESAIEESDAALVALARAETAALVVGGIGVVTLFTQWPLFFIASAAGWEPFEWPPADKAQLIILNLSLDSIYNLSLLWGISTSSAFAMQLASTLVLPVGVVADWILHDTLPSAMAVVGGLVVLFAVVALEMPLSARCEQSWRGVPGQENREGGQVPPADR